MEGIYSIVHILETNCIFNNTMVEILEKCMKAYNKMP